MAYESETGHARGFVVTMRLLWRWLHRFLFMGMLLPLSAVAHQSGNSYVRISAHMYNEVDQYEALIGITRLLP